MKFVRIVSIAIVLAGVISQQNPRAALTQTSAPGIRVTEESSGNITIGKDKDRMKASIPSSDSKIPKEHKPNLIYRGFEASAHGAYYIAKKAVDAVGKATDFLILSVQKASRKIYDRGQQPLNQTGKT